MQHQNLEDHIEFLLCAALQRCGNSYDAQDLTQETLLAALSYLAKGKRIADMRAWLLVVMGRKFNDMLRRKYRQATILVNDAPEAMDEGASTAFCPQEDEAEQVRRSVAYLAESYREVIVRHYMNGESVRQIASSLHLSEGTVKSRLRLGRKQVKKGITDMEKYAKQSYSPITLTVSYSGAPGLNGEPIALVEHDLIAQNILYLAYPAPATCEEIALSIGIPTAYIEPIVQRLVDGELMRRTGNKYYTDFMISTLADMEKHIPAQKKCVREHFDLFWRGIEQALSRLRQCDFYKRCAVDARNALELYVAFHCLDDGTYRTFNTVFHAEQHFKERPNGGRWIAFGHVNLEAFRAEEHQELLAHSYSGERVARFDRYADCKALEIHVYGADGFPAHSYDHSPDVFFPENVSVDAEIAKLLYIIHTGTAPESVGFHPEYLKAIPWLTTCRILREEAGKPVVNIPILSRAEAEVLWGLCKEAVEEMVEDLKGLFAAFFQGKRQALPPHLDSVPLQKQYLYADNAMLFATVREALARGRLYDGHYDDVSNGIHQPPCPMVLIMDR